MDISSTVTLINGVKMPLLGLGVYKVEDGQEVENAVKGALEAGYRMIDTASLYGNEEGVGRAIKASGIAREDLFITTKVWNDDQGYQATLTAFETSLEKLQLEYVDLYLIHWPVKGKFQETWRAMEEIYASKKARAIGVSNFHQQHLMLLESTANIRPMVNQIELHPYLNQKELRHFCQERQIAVEAWSPLARGKALTDATLLKIAEKYDKSIAQIIIRWDLQNGVITIPKSVKQERIVSNAKVYDFELTREEMDAINQLNTNERSGTNPDTYDDK